MAAANLFDRLDRGRPTTATIPERTQRIQRAQKLLDWLQYWGKSTVCIRDIHIFGPGSIRDRESTIDSAEILVEYGWLIPTKAHRRDMRKWQVVRKAIVRPTVTGS